MLSRTAVVTILALALFTPHLLGQEEWYPQPRANVGVTFILSDPVGEFDHFVGTGAGADFFGRLPMDPKGILSLRADLGFLIYGYESKTVCFAGVGCRVQARLETSNNIFFGGIGPELAVPLERARPFVHAFVGYSYFNTTSSLEDEWGHDSEFNTENYGDGTMSWGFGGGLEMNLSQGRVPIDLNLGFRYHQNGRMEYLTEGDIVDNPDGSVTLYPVSSEANLMSYHIGVSIGIPTGRDQY